MLITPWTSNARLRTTTLSWISSAASTISSRSSGNAPSTSSNNPIPRQLANTNQASGPKPRHGVFSKPQVTSRPDAPITTPISSASMPSRSSSAASARYAKAISRNSSSVRFSTANRLPNWIAITAKISIASLASSNPVGYSSKSTNRPAVWNSAATSTNGVTAGLKRCSRTATRANTSAAIPVPNTIATRAAGNSSSQSNCIAAATPASISRPPTIANRLRIQLFELRPWPRAAPISAGLSPCRCASPAIVSSASCRSRERC